MKATRPRPLDRVRVTVLLCAAAFAMSACSTTTDATSATPSATATESPAETHAPVEAVDLAAGEQDAPVEVSVSGDHGVGVTFREITLEPGATTGVHCHYGQLVAVVAEGSLTHYADIYPSGVHVYETGDSIIEGAGYRHEGRNEGDESVVLWVTYIIPEGKPLAETDLSHCDA
ncbi:cupin domain-containing protein [Agreia sp. PsM10]|uniref:cupin domain-containing protein n=1 Tax=Agreia sp. PsM10 TaxID=3030533 RepID=UPI00263BD73A|nr:cupin domain-containing protein [Agreia sp. PsM10]MDN4638700.1 cupin domain-containing protein [Agreia sp. PsM10]